MNSSDLTSEQAAVLITATQRYLRHLRRLKERMDESHFPLDDCLQDATGHLLPYVEAHAKFLDELKLWIEASKQEVRILPNTRRRERYRHVPPKKEGDVF